GRVVPVPVCALSGGSVGPALSVLAAVVDEAEQQGAAVVLERRERHLDWQVGARSRPARERGGGAGTGREDRAHALLQLRELARVDARDRGLEQLLVRVAEERAPGGVGRDEAIGDRVEDERGIGRAFEGVVEIELGSAQACLIPSTYRSTLSG